MNITLLCLQSQPSPAQRRDETRREQEQGSERNEQTQPRIEPEKKKNKDKSNPSSTQVKTTDKLTRQTLKSFDACVRARVKEARVFVVPEYLGR
jgi:hypothetical protein